MKATAKVTKVDPAKLFCPSYQANEKTVHAYSKLAKRFVKITLAALNEINRFENTIEFKNRIAKVERSMKDPIQEKMECIREVKISALQKQLTRITTDLHLNEVLEPNELDLLKKKIIALYRDLISVDQAGLDQVDGFERGLKAIVTEALYKVSCDVVESLSGTVNSNKPSKHKKLTV